MASPSGDPAGSGVQLDGPGVHAVLTAAEDDPDAERLDDLLVEAARRHAGSIAVLQVLADV